MHAPARRWKARDIPDRRVFFHRLIVSPLSKGSLHKYGKALNSMVINMSNADERNIRAIARRWVIWYDMANPMWSS